jgi:glutathione S-transferase
MADNGAPIRIIKLELPDESLKTNRLLARNDSGLYPVIVWFSRPADRFEQMAIEEELDIKFDDDDPMRATHFESKLENFEDEIEGINSSLDNAVANARIDREAAAQEDERLKALAKSLTDKLKSDAASFCDAIGLRVI